ncbi:MAG: endonuclease III [Thermoplasmatota archaeon]|nr:endonuclease III [Candidatus Thermoplasmatota archaeon]MBU1914752.1 endonuclease III [Candidatus Thermoplasmatota archaeon]
MKKRATKVDRILTRVYGRKELALDDAPLDTLVEAILSQNTTDKNSGRAFRKLKDAYPKWERMLGEDSREVAKIIRSGGLAGIKAARILDALEFINRERGALDLDFLRDMEPDEAEAWLGQMKGVGPKTRSIVLLFALGMPAFPVDTHIHRVTRRLGLIGSKTTREQAQEELAKLVPREEFYNFHIDIIEHGRAVCQARKPKCNFCKISQLCDFYGGLAKAQT